MKIETPTGSQIIIYPTGVVDEIPEEGINIAFGPDVQKTIADILANKCGNPDECRKEIVKNLGTPNMYLHAKRGTSPYEIGAWAIGVILSVWAKAMVDKKKGDPGFVPQSAHMEADELSSFTAIPSPVFALKGPGTDVDVATIIVDVTPTMTVP